jgi:hypothetical protein
MMPSARRKLPTRSSPPLPHGSPKVMTDLQEFKGVLLSSKWDHMSNRYSETAFAEKH